MSASPARKNADVGEKLRMKHIRTLEKMQQVVDENNLLKQQLNRLGNDPQRNIDTLSEEPESMMVHERIAMQESTIAGLNLTIEGLKDALMAKSESDSDSIRSSSLEKQRYAARLESESHGDLTRLQDTISLLQTRFEKKSSECSLLERDKLKLEQELKKMKRKLNSKASEPAAAPMSPGSLKSEFDEMQRNLGAVSAVPKLTRQITERLECAEKSLKEADATNTKLISEVGRLHALVVQGDEALIRSKEECETFKERMTETSHLLLELAHEKKIARDATHLVDSANLETQRALKEIEDLKSALVQQDEGAKWRHSQEIDKLLKELAEKDGALLAATRAHEATKSKSANDLRAAATAQEAAGRFKQTAEQVQQRLAKAGADALATRKKLAASEAAAEKARQEAGDSLAQAKRQSEKRSAAGAAEQMKFLQQVQEELESKRTEWQQEQTARQQAERSCNENAKRVIELEQKSKMEGLEASKAKAALAEADKKCERKCREATAESEKKWKEAEARAVEAEAALEGAHARANGHAEKADAAHARATALHAAGSDAEATRRGVHKCARKLRTVLTSVRDELECSRCQKTFQEPVTVMPTGVKVCRRCCNGDELKNVLEVESDSKGGNGSRGLGRRNSGDMLRPSGAGKAAAAILCGGKYAIPDMRLWRVCDHLPELLAALAELPEDTGSESGEEDESGNFEGSDSGEESDTGT
jgi:hypothetical protein